MEIILFEYSHIYIFIYLFTHFIVQTTEEE